MRVGIKGAGVENFSKLISGEMIIRYSRVGTKTRNIYSYINNGSQISSFYKNMNDS